mmetsp:Transcript_10652/g.17902  ORF Transcript_10652/g.17902 Transcript_10652/m.17902 type:complete len:127 (-) Transcript_10652:267-647(-)
MQRQFSMISNESSLQFLQNRQSIVSTATIKGLNQNKTPANQFIPYRDAIRALEHIQYCMTPKEKLNCLNESYGAMKTAVVDFHKGKLELSAMDDVLPITIYVISQINVPNLATEFNILEDFIKVNQ